MFCFDCAPLPHIPHRSVLYSNIYSTLSRFLADMCSVLIVPPPRIFLNGLFYCQFIPDFLQTCVLFWLCPLPPPPIFLTGLFYGPFIPDSLQTYVLFWLCPPPIFLTSLFYIPFFPDSLQTNVLFWLCPPPYSSLVCLYSTHCRFLANMCSFLIVCTPPPYSSLVCFIFHSFQIPCKHMFCFDGAPPPPRIFLTGLFYIPHWSVLYSIPDSLQTCVLFWLCQVYRQSVPKVRSLFALCILKNLQCIKSGGGESFDCAKYMNKLISLDFINFMIGFDKANESQFPVSCYIIFHDCVSDHFIIILYRFIIA